MRVARALLLLAAAAAAAAGVGCGFQLVGKGSSLDPRIKVIAVPLLRNQTEQDELPQLLTEAMVNELVRRGRYTLQSDPAGADAVIEGTVTSFTVRNTSLDEQGRGERAEVSITVDLIFRNRIVDRITWSQNGYLFRQEYEVPETSAGYEEQDVLALEDLSRDFADSVVSTILQGF